MFRMPQRLVRYLSLVAGIACLVLSGTTSQAARPNILWLTCEDISPHLGCYGDPHAITPHLDALAQEGVRYTHAFTTAGVCAPCRSGIITGMYQTTLGTHHMRCQATLPSHVKPFPTFLREQGYYCTNNSKEDYQFKTPAGTWDESSSRAHWRNRENPKQPFFAVFNFTGCHESGISSREKYMRVTKDLTPDQRQSAEELATLPPYYPDTPTVREDWKRNYELITAMDAWAGQRLQELRQDGLAENTIVFFFSDHGVGLPRAKRWLYDSGVRIPLIVRIPQALRVAEQGSPGSVSDALVSSIDFGPTVLHLAGIPLQSHMQGQPFLGEELPAPRTFVYGARDRMDERYDIIRMVRDHRFKYLRNYEPLKPYYQYMNTSEKGATMRVLREGHEAGTLPSIPDRYFASGKPVEELYDTFDDPHEIHNLADDPKYAATLERLRHAHRVWVSETKDVGLIPEPILNNLAAEAGSEYAVLRSTGDPQAIDRIAQVAVAASAGAREFDTLAEHLRDPHPAVRYWSATGLGNLGKEARPAKEMLIEMLADESPTVRVAAARALCNLDRPAAALPVLTDVLNNGAQWERLHAAIVFDEMGEQARPALDTMRAGLQPRSDLYAKGKYTVRVLNRALNELEGTDRQVP